MHAALRRSSPHVIPIQVWHSVLMRVGILGPLEVEADGWVAEIAGPRLRALLIRLALDAGRVVTVESLSYQSGPHHFPYLGIHREFSFG